MDRGTNYWPVNVANQRIDVKSYSCDFQHAAATVGRIVARQVAIGVANGATRRLPRTSRQPVGRVGTDRRRQVAIGVANGASLWRPKDIPLPRTRRRTVIASSARLR